jgi:hypothetical protein
MKTLFLFILFLCILYITSCIADEILDYDIKEKKNEYITSKSIEEEKVLLKVNIINNAENITLNIKNYQIIGIEEIEGIIIENHIIKYSDTINIKNYSLYKQNIPKNTQVIINGELINGEYELYDGLMFIPISGYISEKENTLNLILYPNCKWYDKNGNKILVPITFDVTVEDYENENIIIQ